MLASQRSAARTPYIFLAWLIASSLLTTNALAGGLSSLCGTTKGAASGHPPVPVSAERPHSTPDRAGQQPIRLCLPAGETSPDELKDLASIAHELVQSETFGNYFASLLVSSGVTLCWDPLSVHCRGYFEPETNFIALASGLSRNKKILILVHELRHLDQHRRGFRLSLEHDISEHVRQAYAVEADAQAFVTLFAWQAKEQGDAALWEAAAALDRYEDVAQAFARAAETEAGLEVAMREAFSTWYRSEWRIERYYHSSAANYLDQVDEKHAIRRYATFPPDRFDELCLMPDGSNYDCHLTDELRRERKGPPHP